VTDPQQIRQAATSLRRAIASGHDDLAHPDHEDLVAFAEDKLADVDREIVQAHVDLCAQCAEDVRDISELRDEMAVPVRPVKNTWKYMVGAAALAAAALLIAVKVLGPSSTVPGSQPSIVQGPPPSQTPAPSVLGAEEQTVVDAAIAAGRVEVPATVRALQGQVGQLLGAEPASSRMLPMLPAGTLVANASPTFSWQPLTGAVSYSVAVFDSGFRQVASSSALTSTSWTPSVALPRNVPLAWQVTARMADGTDVLAPAPPLPEARISVIDEAAAASIADLRSRLRDQPIALGILLAKAGLVDDAAREFTRAAAQPELAALATRLRASLSRN
jgi:hypothetical protein